MTDYGDTVTAQSKPGGKTIKGFLNSKAKYFTRRIIFADFSASFRIPKILIYKNSDLKVSTFVIKLFWIRLFFVTVKKSTIECAWIHGSRRAQERTYQMCEKKQ